MNLDFSGDEDIFNFSLRMIFFEIIMLSCFFFMYDVVDVMIGYVMYDVVFLIVFYWNENL